jgi:tetratricopeptide (TPR) repeat protein
LDQRKRKTTKTRKSERSVKNTRVKTVSKRTSPKKGTIRKTSTAQTKRGTGRSTRQSVSKSRQRTHKKSTAMEAELKKKSSSKKTVAPLKNVKPGLLRQTKATSAALSHLEKGIELIFKKEFKKALKELNSLFQSYPDETEILARARSYILICEREEASPPKTEAGTDELYALGVIEHNKANYDAAISYFHQSLKIHPDADYIYYSIAASLAMKGDLAASIENLKKAIELNEDSRIHAKNDQDFSVLGEDEEFAELVGMTSDPSDNPK